MKYCQQALLIGCRVGYFHAYWLASNGYAVIYLIHWLASTSCSDVWTQIGNSSSGERIVLDARGEQLVLCWLLYKHGRCGSAVAFGLHNSAEHINVLHALHFGLWRCYFLLD